MTSLSVSAHHVGRQIVQLRPLSTSSCSPLCTGGPRPGIEIDARTAPETIPADG